MSTERILYIDDEVDLLDLAASFFEDEGLPIKTCSDFNQALELVRNNRYDLIISDAKMPSGSGFELLEIIKKEGHFHGKTILVTGNLQNMSDVDKTGFDRVIFKPISFQDLIDQVRSLIG